MNLPDPKTCGFHDRGEPCRKRAVFTKGEHMRACEHHALVEGWVRVRVERDDDVGIVPP